MAWDDDKKAKVIGMYQEREPTPENSLEIVKEIAEEVGETANGVRMILSKAEVYIKKDQSSGGTKKAASGGNGGGTARVSKEAAHARLTTAIEATGGSVDAEIVSKLTGKAAIYIAEILENKVAE